MDVDPNILGYFKASKKRTRVLEALAKGPENQATLKDIADISFTYIHEIITYMLENGIVEIVTTDRQKSKLYGLTELGKKYLKK